MAQIITAPPFRCPLCWRSGAHASDATATRRYWSEDKSNVALDLLCLKISSQLLNAQVENSDDTIIFFI